MLGVELFSGAGGMSVGAKMAGVDVKLAVEIDKYAAQTFIHNHKSTKIINDDIRNVQNVAVKKNGVPCVLFGGPPCQGFSRSNHRTRNKKNPNNWLFEEFIRISNLWKPDWVVLENVQGLLGTENGIFLEQILELLHKIGYSSTYKVLNAKNFGVPQNRERLFIVGSKHGIWFDFPDDLNGGIVSVKKALLDLPVLENGNCLETLNYKTKNCSVYAKELRGDQRKCTNNGVSKSTDIVLKRYEHIPQGGNWQDIPKRLMKSYTDVSRCHTGIYHRLDENKESVVIGNYRKNMLVHPWQNRGLSVREAARLQSFPDDFVFHGHLGDQQQQVGNAVPPKLAKAVFEKILSY